MQHKNRFWRRFYDILGLWQWQPDFSLRLTLLVITEKILCLAGVCTYAIMLVWRMVNSGYCDMGVSRSKVDLYIPYTCDSLLQDLWKYLDVYNEKYVFEDVIDGWK
jgi:hypothetical protein